MDLQYLKNVAVYFFSAILSLLVILYIVYHLVNSFRVEVEFIPAEIVTESERMTLDAYIMRDEQVIYASADGEINYLCGDGVKIPADTHIADIYSGHSESDSRSSMIEIDNKISLLSASGVSGSFTLADTKSVDSQISDLVLVIRNRVESGDIDYALHKNGELLRLLNKRQIITGAVSGYDSRINELKSRKQSISAGLVDIAETVTVEESGYFYSALDGYENIFSSSRIDELTLDGFAAMKESQPESAYSDTAKHGIGKIVNDYNWYVASEVTKSDLKYFSEGYSYTVIFPYNSDIELSMKLYRIVSQTNDDRAILIFSSGTIPNNFNFLRMQEVEVVKNSYKGYRVPISAVRMVDGKEGVYILDGNIVRYKRIDPLYEADGYMIVAEQNRFKDEEYLSKLALYDMIIIKGKELYEGKIVT